jgi:AGZA family xanthine/uracil permease-like MFS transporter
MRWFVRGDIDGFFGLALDNLVQVLLIVFLCARVLDFDSALVFGTILPGVCVSLLVGNLFYAWQAKELGVRTRRSDVCALPYGINTVSLIAHVYLVMLPAKMEVDALTQGRSPELAARVAWQAGLAACFGSGLIEFVGAFFVRYLRRITPRAALLSTLAGIAIGFISMAFFLRTYARPIIGLSTLAIILVVYFGGVRFRGRLPGGLIAVGLGTAIAWFTGLAPDTSMRVDPPSFHPPLPVIGDLIRGFEMGAFTKYLSVIIPMGLFNLIGSLQNLESAEAAGDRYNAAPSLAMNGLGSIAAAGFGSCFPTTIYIGHPGWKALGARAGYSVLNAVFFTIVCLGGLLGAIAYAVPVDAGMAIVLFIGIVISAQAFQATPREHAPAVVVGLLPGLAAWGTLMARQALGVAGVGAPGGPPFNDAVVPPFQARDLYIDGGFALAEGFILTSMILAAATVCIIEKRFRQAGGWCLAGAALSACGLMHSYQYGPGGPQLSLFMPIRDWANGYSPAWDWTIGYAIMAAFLFVAPLITRDPFSRDP